MESQSVLCTAVAVAIRTCKKRYSGRKDFDNAIAITIKESVLPRCVSLIVVHLMDLQLGTPAMSARYAAKSSLATPPSYSVLTSTPKLLLHLQPPMQRWMWVVVSSTSCLGSHSVADCDLVLVPAMDQPWTLRSGTGRYIWYLPS